MIQSYVIYKKSRCSFALILVCQNTSRRTRDLTPSHATSGYGGKEEPNLSSSGGGESFLQFMEEGNSTDSVIICSTNHPSILDRALLRRYDQVLEFDAPTSGQIRQLVSANITPMAGNA